MNSFNICIFGGTTEGRMFAEFLEANNIKADLYIATTYGQQFVKDLKNINIHQKRIDEKEMISLFLEKKYDYIIDATHPFAKVVSENIVNASKISGARYLRIIRKSSERTDCIYFDSYSQCVDYLKDKDGNILLTTGSKNLDEFTAIPNYADKIYVRILPMESSLRRCIELGYLNRNIICMQGPFSEELNVAMIRSTNVKYLVTKESSDSGGFNEKVQACIKTGAKCLVIRKQHEAGYTLYDICKFFKEQYHEKS
mgnify:CR=1 FL=1